ncbi:MAG: flagellar hook assembly protein FlgD [Rhodobacteraceae bacterium]|jgi:flagellar basal-body rod modification protein FlgD|nr:flagellar hook assembly protein FlgD [Paracoccaceae bacterium]
MTTSAITSSLSQTSTTASTRSQISSDFDTFLKMLTAQMQNQDPLNPIDSTDYATQLATFSGVEQQTRTNDLLTNLGSQIAVLGMSQLASWVGQEARAEAPVWMDGDPVTMQLSPEFGADRAVLVVRDASGSLVSREDVPIEAGLYEWLGGDAEGNLLPQGLYDLTLESYSGATLLGESPIESYARIFEARNGEGGTTLVLEGGVEVPSVKITALRMPLNS